MILDLFQTNFSKNLKFWVFLGLSKEKYCSEYFEVERKTIFIDTVEKTFLRKVDTYRKLPLQKIFLKMCRCNI